VEKKISTQSLTGNANGQKIKEFFSKRLADKAQAHSARPQLCCVDRELDWVGDVNAFGGLPFPASLVKPSPSNSTSLRNSNQ